MRKGFNNFIKKAVGIEILTYFGALPLLTLQTSKPLTLNLAPPQLLKRSRSKAFTLAETLITLGIVAIVATMTIPNLVKNYQIEQFRTQLKKEYSVLTQAINSLYALNYTIDTSTSTKFVDELETQITMVKRGTWKTLTTLPADFNYKCYKNSTGICANGSGTSLLARPAADNYQSFIAKDGTLIIIAAAYTNCDGNNASYVRIFPSDPIPQNNVCANIRMDLNGDKGPNQLGVDLHPFLLLKKDEVYYLRPFGSNKSTACSSAYPDTFTESIYCSNRMLLDMPMP